MAAQACPWCDEKPQWLHPLAIHANPHQHQNGTNQDSCTANLRQRCGHAISRQTPGSSPGLPLQAYRRAQPHEASRAVFFLLGSATGGSLSCSLRQQRQRKYSVAPLRSFQPKRCRRGANTRPNQSLTASAAHSTHAGRRNATARQLDPEGSRRGSGGRRGRFGRGREVVDGEGEEGRRARVRETSHRERRRQARAERRAPVYLCLEPSFVIRESGRQHSISSPHARGVATTSSYATITFVTLSPSIPKSE